MSSKYKSVERNALLLKKKIERCAKKYTTTSEIARKVGINYGTLKKYAGIVGVELPKRDKGRPPQIIDEAKAKYLYEKNVPFKEMGEQPGVHLRSVRNFCIEMGWKRSGASILRLRTRLDPRTQKIIDLRLAGNTLKSISDEFGVTNERIRQIVRDYWHTQVLDRQFAEACIELLARGYNWEQIQHMIGSESPVMHFQAAIEHLFTEEEKAMYFV